MKADCTDLVKRSAVAALVGWGGAYFYTSFLVFSKRL